MSALAAPTFNGNAMFGSSVKMLAGVINPVAVQVNSYPALNGLETLVQGKRGGQCLVTGRLGGYGGAGLNAAQSFFRTFYDGRAYLLTDQFGNLWPFTKLDTFQPEGQMYVDPADGWVWQAYRAVFIHLMV